MFREPLLLGAVGGRGTGTFQVPSDPQSLRGWNVLASHSHALQRAGLYADTEQLARYLVRPGSWPESLTLAFPLVLSDMWARHSAPEHLQVDTGSPAMRPNSQHARPPASCHPATPRAWTLLWALKAQAALLQP